MMRSGCRIWWPKELACSEGSEASVSTLLFGWFFSSSSSSPSLDVVVASASTRLSLSISQSRLQEIVRHANENMPFRLQNKSMFSVLGQCVVEEEEEGGGENRKNCKGRGCGCHPFNESSHWILFVYDSRKQCGRGVYWFPKVDHIHWNGQIVCPSNVHVLIYETPVYGMRHLSLNCWNSLEQSKASLKMPNWVSELDKRRSPLDMDTVILAINSTAAAAKIVLDERVGSKRCGARCLAFMWQIFAIAVASISTLLYIILQLLRGFLTVGTKTWMFVTLARVFCTTWTNIKIRCGQMLYWPIFLQDNHLRSQSCVEYAEKAALHRHSMWSSLAVDLLLGNLIGLSLLFHAEQACMLVFTFANNVTNELLRSGCVWLMGVPAGFKLNTELAGVLGMASLNAIQIWSTLWIFMGFLFIYFIKGLALLGIILGATIPAALIIDMVALATLHVSTLHCAISLLYSWQIQALAAIWRLFRGRKWNPLRQRLDSYDYTVKQHIVGSLLFTPLILLLPTTSVFYIFFTILNAAIAFVSIMIELTISVVHCTPYMEIFLWVVRRRRFPFGIWFEIVSCESDCSQSVYPDKVSSSLENSHQKKDRCEKSSYVIVSVLHSNYSSIGRIVMPHYKKVFSGVSGFVTTSALGALTGKRSSSSLGSGLPLTMPWMFIPIREYWYLCHNSILSCVCQ